MLAVMTMNVGYFMSVLGGVFLGSFVLGGWNTEKTWMGMELEMEMEMWCLSATDLRKPSLGWGDDARYVGRVFIRV
jgi:hypothetical protein